MTTVAAVLIVRNEALVLARCLSTVREHVDEIVVADTGSTDRTVAIARTFGAKVVHFAWIDDFAAARQFAFDNATADWCFWLDADDVIINPERIQPLVARASDDVAGFQWRTIIGRDAAGGPAFSYWRERCVRNDGLARWAGRVHEVLITPGGRRVVQTDEVSVEHQPPAGRPKEPGRNLRILEAEYNAADGSPGPRTLFYLGREYADNGRIDEAIEILTRSGREDPWPDQRYLAMVHVGTMLIVKGLHREAIDAFLESLKTHPSWPDAYFGLAQSYYYLHEWANVVHWIEIARTRPDPETPLFRNAWKLRVEWLIFYTNALHHTGRTTEALEWTRAALALDPGNQWHTANLAFFEQTLSGSDHDAVCLDPGGDPQPC